MVRVGGRGAAASEADVAQVRVWGTHRRLREGRDDERQHRRVRGAAFVADRGGATNPSSDGDTGDGTASVDAGADLTDGCTGRPSRRRACRRQGCGGTGYRDGL